MVTKDLYWQNKIFCHLHGPNILAGIDFQDYLGRFHSRVYYNFDNFVFGAKPLQEMKSETDRPLLIHLTDLFTTHSN